MLMGRLDAPGSAGNSPSRTEYAGTGLVPTQVVDGMGTAVSASQVTAPVHGDSLRPPDPAVGGITGPSNVLGWTTGLRVSQAFRKRFTGATLVVPATDVSYAIGPVGNKLGRPSPGRVAALSNDYSTDGTAVAASLGGQFTGGAGPNPALLGAHIAVPSLGKSFNPLLREMG